LGSHKSKSNLLEASLSNKNLKTLVRCSIFAALLVLWGGCPWVWAGDRNTVEPISLNKLKDLIASENSKYVIVVMAAWCGPCIKELPDLVKIDNSLGPRGLNMIGISIDTGGPAVMQPYVDKYNINFPVYWVGENAVDEFNIYGIPMIMLVKDGQIREKIIGKRSRRFLKKKIKAFLNSG
jgi:thiol-disulfide isomerase/thioredoxin